MTTIPNAPHRVRRTCRLDASRSRKPASAAPSVKAVSFSSMREAMSGSWRRGCPCDRAGSGARSRTRLRISATRRGALDAESTILHDVEITEKLPLQRVEPGSRRALRHGPVELAPVCTGTLGERARHEGFVVDRVDQHIEAADRVGPVHAQRHRDDARPGRRRSPGSRGSSSGYGTTRSATRSPAVMARPPPSASSWGESHTGPGPCRPGGRGTAVELPGGCVWSSNSQPLVTEYTLWVTVSALTKVTVSPTRMRRDLLGERLVLLDDPRVTRPRAGDKRDCRQSGRRHHQIRLRPASHRRSRRSVCVIAAAPAPASPAPRS